MPGKITIQHTRMFVLVLLAATALFTAFAWVRSQRYVTHQSTPPRRVPPNISQSAGFSLSQTEKGRTVFTIKAARVRQQQDSGKSVLEEMEVITFGAQGNRHDRISSKQCEYDSKNEVAYCDGEVEIELASLPGEAAAPAPDGVPAPPPRSAPQQAGSDSEKPPRGIVAKTSGLTFQQKTGIASTDKPVEFRFSRGDGRAIGAVYDSGRRTLQLKSAVAVTLAQSGPVLAATMQTLVKAAELLYAQRDNKLELQRPEVRRALPKGGSRQVTGDRGTITLDERSQVRNALIDGNVRMDETSPGSTPQTPRETHATTDRADLIFTEDQALGQAYLVGNVRMATVNGGNRSEAQAARLELFFNGPDNALGQVEWKGGVRMVLTPAAKDADVRVITSDAMEMFMKPDGTQLANARTLAPGRLELLPVTPGRKSRRVLTANRLWMEFGDDNQVRMLTADKAVRLETEVPPRQRVTQAAEGRPPGAAGRGSQPAQAVLRVTTSDQLAAHFDDRQELQTVEQTGNFRYLEGEQQATADRAYYTAADEKILLTGHPGRNPEVWDAHTRTTARQITFDEQNDVGIAEHDVRTRHLPEQKTGQAAPGPLAGKEPVNVIADRMVANSKTGVTRYESAPGGWRVRLWQNKDVIEARTVVLEREERRLTAQGEVTTVFTESSPGATAAPVTPAPADERPSRPIFISADSLVYTDADRRAHYERRVLLRREASTMKSAALDTYLLPAGEVKPGQSRLERALARGAVQIVETSPRGKRRGAAEMAEYISAEDKMVLSGGEPYIFDEQRGYTRGRQLTYYVRDDRIFVHGDSVARTVTEQRVTKRR